MKPFISCCGLDCEACDARIATVTNDDNLRQKIVDQWTAQHEIVGLTMEMINCSGCREEGPKIGHCAECGVRNCGKNAGLTTCAECAELTTCTIVGEIHAMAPHALENLQAAR